MKSSIDDVSTIGWENEDSIASVISNEEKVFDATMGELDMDDIEEDKL
jgi:hypothetical protein